HCRHADHRQRGRGRGEHSAGLANAIEVAEELQLDVEVLGDGLHYEIDVGERLARGGTGDAGQHLVAIGLAHAPLVHGTVERLGYRSTDPGRLLFATGHKGDGVTRLSKHLDDA
ncbi:hypothetical protein RZS08_55925, partial [Arthrospira platensis SPKY1]|nr:hypothetical protein [Arthrospira platensis SPKY1]